MRAWLRRALAEVVTSAPADISRLASYTTGMEHSPTSATGTGWKRTPRARDTASGMGGA
jgi:hypothetical protein